MPALPDVRVLGGLRLAEDVDVVVGHALLHEGWVGRDRRGGTVGRLRHHQGAHQTALRYAARSSCRWLQLLHCCCAHCAAAGYASCWYACFLAVIVFLPEQ